MKIYIKFLTNIYFRSLFYVVGVMISLVFILNYLGELDFFQKIETKTHFTIFLALVNSPATIFDMTPFIFLISVQIFFIKLFDNSDTFIYYWNFSHNIVLLFFI